MKSVTFHIPEQADYTKTGEEKQAMWNAVNGSWKRNGSNFVDMSLCHKMMNQAIGQLKNALNSPFNSVRASKDEKFNAVFTALLSDVTDIAEALQSIQRFENGAFKGTLSDFLGYVSGRQSENAKTAAQSSDYDNMKALFAQLTSLLGGKVDQPAVSAANKVAAAVDRVQQTTEFAAQGEEIDDAAIEAAKLILQSAALRTGNKKAA